MSRGPLDKDVGDVRRHFRRWGEVWLEYRGPPPNGRYVLKKMHPVEAAESYCRGAPLLYVVTVSSADGVERPKTPEELADLCASPGVSCYIFGDVVWGPEAASVCTSYVVAVGINSLKDALRALVEFGVQIRRRSWVEFDRSVLELAGLCDEVPGICDPPPPPEERRNAPQKASPAPGGDAASSISTASATGEADLRQDGDPAASECVKLVARCLGEELASRLRSCYA
jgi:hypothetical protein